jgi:hypothetical protein
MAGSVISRWAVSVTRALLCAVILLPAGLSVELAAQETAQPQEFPTHTLHVYANLIQIPTLVLGPYGQQLRKPIPEKNFSISIDGGPWFRATHVRLEGDDPISLSILLDLDGDTSTLMPKMNEVVAKLSPLFLHSQDHVSVYALECSLIRSLDDVPAESVSLKLAVDRALASWQFRQQNRHEPRCQQSIHLRDALTLLVNRLRELPGRRVILVVSDGEDHGSQRSWNTVRLFAQSNGVAIFGMTYIPQYSVGDTGFYAKWGRDNPFFSFCQLTGGMVLLTSDLSLGDTMKRFTAMLRERYIVEFPRPANGTPGQHGLEVRADKNSGNIIHASGVSVPIPDAALLADPTTVKSDPSLTPEQGKQRVITKPQ